jgi:hypothetical protein
MFGDGYSEALSRLVSVIGAIVLALTVVGAAVGPAAVAQAAPTSPGFTCDAMLA